MQTYKTFVFDSYELNVAARQIILKYSYDDALHFTETFDLSADLPLERAHEPDVKRALFALHLAGGVSYYKAYCLPNIRIDSGTLSQKQAEFWNQFYTKGLGELFYQNQIDFRDLIHFPTSAEGSEAHVVAAAPPQGHHDIHDHDGTEASAKAANGQSGHFKRALTPFGGGKDSVLTMELLRTHDIDQTLFRVNSHHFIDKLVEKTGLPMLTVQRNFDRSVINLRTQGGYSGHIPITGYIGFLTVVVSLLGGYDSVWFSNERSADFGNVDYLGATINHQWSKSIEAEELQRSYIRHFITGDVQFASMLRPLGELRIAQLFSHYPQYFSTTTSCNVNWKMLEQNPSDNPWCGQCNKCAFIFALYAATLPGDTAVAMYGKNMFNDASLVHMYRQLWGAEGIKPFDCVGTIEEMQAAMLLALKKPVYADTVIGRDFAQHMTPRLSHAEKIIGTALASDTGGVPAHVLHMLKGVL